MTCVMLWHVLVMLWYSVWAMQSSTTDGDRFFHYRHFRFFGPKRLFCPILDHLGTSGTFWACLHGQSSDMPFQPCILGPAADTATAADDDDATDDDAADGAAADGAATDGAGALVVNSILEVMGRAMIQRQEQTLQTDTQTNYCCDGKRLIKAKCLSV